MGGILHGVCLPSEPPFDPVRNAAEGAATRADTQHGEIDAASAPWPARPATGLTIDWFLAVFDKQNAIEAASLAHYQARTDGQPPPPIRDGIVREYAYVIGQTVLWRDNAPTAEHRKVHEGAISSFHSCIREWQNYRAAHALGIELTREETERAVATLSDEVRMRVKRRLYGPHGSDPGPA